MPLQPAVLGTARLNNFRLNYRAATAQSYAIAVVIGGVDVTAHVLYKSLTIRDALFEAPNTCALTLYGVAPTVGQPIAISINPDAPQVLFNGEIQTVARTYKGRPTTVLQAVTAIDDTARANRRRPLGSAVNGSATAIAQWLISNYAPGFTAAGVEVNLPLVSITFDGSEAGMKGCLTALAKLIGGYWYFENQTLYFFLTPVGTPPDPIDETPGRFLHDPPITWAIDKSQVRTRVFGKGAGTPIATTIAAGTDRVPVVNAEMFNPAGGRAIAAGTPDGAAWNVVTYTGMQLGGGGGLVGPGAAPSVALALAQYDGTGVETGQHRYAYTFVTAAGESLPSPIATIAVGPVPPPAALPVPGNPTAGGAVDPGVHGYAVTFVTPTGETTSPAVWQTVTTTVGTSVPTPGTTAAALRKVVGNLANGVSYRYVTTITVTGGETLPGPAGAAITPTTMPGPPNVSQSIGLETGALVVDQIYVYALAFLVGGSYETALSPSVVVDLPPDPLYTRVVFQNVAVSADARVTGRKLYRAVGAQWRLVTTIPDNLPNTWYRDDASDASLGAARAGTGAIGTPPGDQAIVTVPTSGDPRAVGRKIYRSDNGAPFRYLAAIANTTPTTYTDNTASVASHADAPTIDTTGETSYQTVPISGIVTGPPTVTARRLYRFSPGQSAYRLLTTIANNTQTTYTDTQPTAALGAALPTVNTATANRVQLTVPLGGATVTGRKIYRSKANVEALQYWNQFTDNTSTWTVDGQADNTLGAGPPGADTSGLVQPNGQIPAGATVMIVANTSAFADAGGWAVVGNGEQVIRYTSKSATALLGIPATGPGALVASVAYNSTVTASPALVGVSGIVAVIRNSPLHVWVQRDDPAAQAAMAALDGGGDGVYEHIWSDERRSEASLNQVCDAQLAVYSRPIVTVTYATRDLKTKSGKTVTIALPSLGIFETLTIQDVQISELGIAGLAPKFTVTASSVRQSLDAVLQMLLRKADA